MRGFTNTSCSLASHTDADAKIPSSYDRIAHPYTRHGQFIIQLRAYVAGSIHLYVPRHSARTRCRRTCAEWFVCFVCLCLVFGWLVAAVASDACPQCRATWNSWIACADFPELKSVALTGRCSYAVGEGVRCVEDLIYRFAEDQGRWRRRCCFHRRCCRNQWIM